MSVYRQYRQIPVAASVFVTTCILHYICASATYILRPIIYRKQQPAFTVHLAQRSTWLCSRLRPPLTAQKQIHKSCCLLLFSWNLHSEVLSNIDTVLILSIKHLVKNLYRVGLYRIDALMLFWLNATKQFALQAATPLIAAAHPSSTTQHGSALHSTTQHSTARQCTA
jgi:hypothetical protein